MCNVNKVGDVTDFRELNLTSTTQITQIEGNKYSEHCDSLNMASIKKSQISQTQEWNKNVMHKI